MVEKPRSLLYNGSRSVSCNVSIIACNLLKYALRNRTAMRVPYIVQILLFEELIYFGEWIIENRPYQALVINICDAAVFDKMP
jgi:hypothetical protein